MYHVTEFAVKIYISPFTNVTFAEKKVWGPFTHVIEFAMKKELFTHKFKAKLASLSFPWQNILWHFLAFYWQF